MASRSRTFVRSEAEAFIRTAERSLRRPVPDAPVSKFVLTMKGGKKGLIQSSTNLCDRENRAVAKFDPHNGRIRDFNPVARARCAKKKRTGGGGE